MDRKTTPLKIVAAIDVVLSIIPIIYGLVLIIPPITNHLLDQKDEAEPTEAPPIGPILHFDTKLTRLYMELLNVAVAVYVTIVIIGVVGVHAVQALMAIILFLAADKIVLDPLEASAKFKGYLLWCLVFLIFLIIVTIIYAALLSFYYISWILFSFLIIQILFRVLAMYMVQSCRVAIRRQFLHSEVPWINPSLPTATL